MRIVYFRSSPSLLLLPLLLVGTVLLYFNATRPVALRPVKLNAEDLFAHGLSPFETSGPESFMAGGVLSLTLGIR